MRHPKTCLASLIALVLTASLFGLASLRAQDDPEHRMAEVGTGLVCDTKEQVVRFVELHQGNVEATLAAVNNEAGSAVCAVMPMLYLRGDTVGHLQRGSDAYVVSTVLVLGVVYGGMLFPLSEPHPQFALFRVDTAASSPSQRDT